MDSDAKAIVITIAIIAIFGTIGVICGYDCNVKANMGEVETNRVNQIELTRRIKEIEKNKTHRQKNIGKMRLECLKIKSVPECKDAFKNEKVGENEK